MPVEEDAAKMWELVKIDPHLDLNSLYYYLMVTTHLRETCVVAENGHQFLGFASGMILPREPNTLFVWQIATTPSYRGRGLGTTLLEELLERPYRAPVRYLSATITPDNDASWHLFHKIAKRHKTRLATLGKLKRQWFAPENHDEEQIIKIGPFPIQP